MDLESARHEFESKAQIFGRLKEEVLFILDLAINDACIKLHSISHRVKDIDSFLDKIQRKESKKPFEEIRDIVGIRVICLFLSDIERIANVIRESFIVLEEDNKVEGSDVSSFGYMSIHFIATTKTEHSGPRYDAIANTPFEIQVRTIAMDAWANVSHYLSYKSDKDVPSELRRDFYALSGLFYVADRHFEMFFRSSEKSQEKMVELFEVATPEAQSQHEINLDSLSAYLHTKFPDRRHSDSTNVSELISELMKTKYKTIGDIDRMVDAAQEAFLLFEREYPPMAVGNKFSDIGVIRVSAEIADEKYHRMRFFDDREYRELSEEDLKDEYYVAAKALYATYRPLLKQLDGEAHSTTPNNSSYTPPQ